MRLQLVMGLVISLLCAASAARGQAVDPRAEAKAAIIQAYLSANTDSINRLIADAIRHGRLAVAQWPQDAESHYWLAAALGRRTQRADITGALRAGRESYREARRALALDSTHAGAHALIGRFQEDGARMAWPLRTMAAAVAGIAELRRVTLADAERSYRTAVRFAPNAIQYRNDLGRFLAESGRHAEADEQWRIARELPTREPIEEWMRNDLRRRIDEARRTR